MFGNLKKKLKGVLGSFSKKVEEEAEEIVEEVVEEPLVKKKKEVSKLKTPVKANSPKKKNSVANEKSSNDGNSIIKEKKEVIGKESIKISIEMCFTNLPIWMISKWFIYLQISILDLSIAY